MSKTIAAIVEYDGSHYHGWQIQKNALSVQECIEKAISNVADETIRVYCAGRTDAGVHACGQVIHFKTEKNRTQESWLRGINSNLPNTIAIPWISQVNDDFHARFKAQSRHYRYIYYSRRIAPGYLYPYVSWNYRLLNVERMQIAANDLLGKHDFNAYRAIACQSKTSIRTLTNLSINSVGCFIYIDVEADGFLHHMVRNISGVLAQIGCGNKSTNWAKEVLLSKNRASGGVTAPANGLYLTQVNYEQRYEIPKPSIIAKYW